jgi:predicted acyl esterase
MENNVFIMANYTWPFYVADNRYLDERTYHDTRWQSLPRQWYASGRPYREVDGVSGTPNKWLQRWLMHPAYDEYWQARVPYKNDYSKINIPVLAING